MKVKTCEAFVLCGSVVPPYESELRLRAMGWHHYTGPSFSAGGLETRDLIEKWLCPSCLKKRRAVKDVELEGQEELF
jgi:hypothetical protein